MVKFIYFFFNFEQSEFVVLYISLPTLLSWVKSTGVRHTCRKDQYLVSYF